MNWFDRVIYLPKCIKSQAILKLKIGPSSSLDDALNLSILVSAGKENNNDWLSKGDRNAKSTNFQSTWSYSRRIVVY